MADPPRREDEAVDEDDEAISTAEDQSPEAERSPRSEELTNEGAGATVIMVSGSPLRSTSPPSVEKASSDIENNATQCSDDQEVGSNPSLLGDLEDERDHGGRAEQAESDPNDPEGIELGVCRRPYYCGGRPYRFYVLGELDRRRRRRLLVLIGAIAAALLLLLVLIVGSTCGSGHCGGGGTLSAATSEYNNPTPTNDTSQVEGEADPEFYHDRSPRPTPTPTTATLPPFPLPSGTPLEMLGPNVVVFNASVSTADIQAQCDAIFYKQQNNEMGTERYGIYFMPGVYGSAEQPLMLQIGYYTDVAGLGEYPGDVLIYGKIEVYNRCFEPSPYAEGKFVPATDGSTGLCFALNSFWRSLSNLAIQIVSLNQDSCRSQALFWAVSQASSMRRVDVRGGDMSLMDFCTNPAYASGGFIADSRAGKIISGSQQQFLSRNMDIALWDGTVWNQVFMGVNGAPVDTSFPDPAITTFATTPVKREKPYLYVDSTGELWVRVPSLQTDTAGVTWSTEGVPTPGTSIPFSDFFVANPLQHSASALNAMLAAGKHLLLTPGVYDIDRTVVVDRAGAVVLGLGQATLTAVGGATALRVMNRPGIVVAGVTVDAGEELSESLLEVGSPDEDPQGDISDPITLSDVYFRLGGPHIGKAKVCLKINCNDVLIDHTWVWRADHGVEPFDETQGFMGDDERWRINVGEMGVEVNGDDVVANGLFVEHFQQYNVLWKGERGRVYFFQNELPYDPPTQEDWMASDGKLGWAAYKVDAAVTDHQVWAGGVYCYNRNNPSIVTERAFDVPQSSGVVLNRVFTRNLSGPGSILSIVNGVGEAVTNATVGPFYLTQYSR